MTPLSVPSLAHCSDYMDVLLKGIASAICLQLGLAFLIDLWPLRSLPTAISPRPKARMPRFVPHRHSFRALLALAAALVLASLALAAPANAHPVPSGTSITANASMSATAAIRPMEIYDWAEVYFGTGEIAQGQTLQVTVSDLRTGRIITADLGGGAVTVADIPAADRYGDTGFAVPIPADFPLGVHNLTISTDEFAPIVIPITITAGEGAPVETTEPAPSMTTDPTGPTGPTGPTTEPTEPTGESSTPDPGSADSSIGEPPVPLSVVFGVLGGIAVLIVVTAIVRRARGTNA